MSLMGYLGIGFLALIIGFSIGWGIAYLLIKRNITKIKKGLTNNLSLDEIKKEKKDDEEFWEMKNKILDERKKKYKEVKNGRNGTKKQDEGTRTNNQDRGTGDREQEPQIDSSSQRGTELQNTPIEPVKPDSEGTTLSDPNELRTE